LHFLSLGQVTTLPPSGVHLTKTGQPHSPMITVGFSPLGHLSIGGHGVLTHVDLQHLHSSSSTVIWWHFGHSFLAGGHGFFSQVHDLQHPSDSSLSTSQVVLQAGGAVCSQGTAIFVPQPHASVPSVTVNLPGSQALTGSLLQGLFLKISQLHSSNLGFPSTSSGT